jgi:hypothetical protein
MMYAGGDCSIANVSSLKSDDTYHDDMLVSQPSSIRDHDRCASETPSCSIVVRLRGRWSQMRCQRVCLMARN